MAYKTIESKTHNGYRLKLIRYQDAYYIEGENLNVKSRRLYKRWAIHTKSIDEARAEYYRTRDELLRIGRLDRLFVSNISDWIDIFLNHSKIKSKSKKTYESHRISMKYFRSFVEEGKVTSLTQVTYEQYILYLTRIACPSCGIIGNIDREFDEIKNQESMVRCVKCKEVFSTTKLIRSSRTIDIRLTAILAMIHALEDLDITTRGSIPHPKLLRAEKTTLPKFWTDEEALKIIAAAGNRYIRDMIVLAFNTGLRRTELVHLRWEDINFDGGFFNVQGYDIEYNGTRVTFEPKDHESRRIKLNAAARECLTALRAKFSGAPWVFANSNGVPRRNVGPLDRDLREVFAAAGVEKKGGWHSLRRTFAVHLLMNGADIESIRQLLGHAKISTTQKYLNVTARHLDKTVDLIDFSPPLGDNIVRIRKK